MIIFLISVGIDLATRIFIDPAKVMNESKKEGESIQSTSDNTTTTPKEDTMYHKKNEEFFLEDNVNIQMNNGIIEVSLCDSCGYANKMEELKKYVQKYFPSIQFRVTNYPIGLAHTMLGYLVRLVQIVFGCFMIFGDKIFEKMQMQPWPIYTKMVESKFMYMMLIIMGGNMLCSSLQSSGAFEVFYNGTLLHSKLSSGKYPEPDYIVHQLYELTK